MLEWSFVGHIWFEKLPILGFNILQYFGLVVVGHGTTQLTNHIIRKNAITYLIKNMLCSCIM